MMDYLISCIASFICIKYRKPFFIIIIPFFSLAGTFIRRAEFPVEYGFLISFVELFIISLFFLEYRLKSVIARYIAFLPFLSIPATLQINDGIGYSVFITLEMFFSAWLYEFFLRNMDFMIKKKFPEIMTVLWIFLAASVRIYNEFVYGENYLPFGEYALIERGGYMGSNYLGGLILMIFPLLESTFVTVFGVLYMVTTFSRGIFLILFIFVPYKFMMISLREKIQVIKYSIIFIMLASLLIPYQLQDTAYNYIQSRIIGNQETHNWLTAVDLIGGAAQEKIQNETRSRIFENGLTIFAKSNFFGIGLGQFRWGLELIGELPIYSNAHNLYITILSEGGFLFFMGFMALFIYMILLSVKYSRKGLVSLIIFGIYGLYSGQIYAASNMASSVNYYVLLFVFSYIEYSQIMVLN